MTNEMNIHVAVRLWLEGKITVFQVQEACGHVSVAEMYEQFMEIEANVSLASHLVTSEEAGRDELTDLAYQLYADILHEQPAYLDQILEGLRKQKRRELRQFAARFNSRRKGSDGSNVLPFVHH